MNSTKVILCPLLKHSRGKCHWRSWFQIVKTKSFPSVPDKPQSQPSSKINKLVAEIAQLDPLEMSELSRALKKRLNLPDAPLMPAGGFVGASTAENEEEIVPKQVYSETNERTWHISYWILETK